MTGEDENKVRGFRLAPRYGAGAACSLLAKIELSIVREMPNRFAGLGASFGGMIAAQIRPVPPATYYRGTCSKRRRQMRRRCSDTSIMARAGAAHLHPARQTKIKIKIKIKIKFKVKVKTHGGNSPNTSPRKVQPHAHMTARSW